MTYPAERDRNALSEISFSKTVQGPVIDMARYFIDFRDSTGMIRDEEGGDFSHLEDALDEAKASARDLVKQYLDDQTPLNETCVEIRDQQGRTVAALTVAEVLQHPIHPNFKNACADLPRPGHR
jgi:hypothetical protein